MSTVLWMLHWVVFLLQHQQKNLRRTCSQVYLSVPVSRYVRYLLTVNRGRYTGTLSKGKRLTSPRSLSFSCLELNLISWSDHPFHSSPPNRPLFSNIQEDTYHISWVELKSVGKKGRRETCGRGFPRIRFSNGVSDPEPSRGGAPDVGTYSKVRPRELFNLRNPIRIKSNETFINDEGNAPGVHLLLVATSPTYRLKRMYRWTLATVGILYTGRT